MKRKIKLLSVLALLLMAVTQGAWAAPTLSQDGSGNYTISSPDDWTTFCSDVSGGETYSGKTVVLTKDISVTTKCGTVSGSEQQKAFSGTFDGGGHTITANITDTDNQGTALFAYINGATIKNLTVAGSVSGTQHVAAIVGFSNGTGNVIENCKATASVSCNNTHMGGILGHGKASDIAIRGCVFSGLMTGATTAKGALFGWGDNGGTKTVSDCLYVMASGQDTASLDLAKMSGGSVTMSNCYKTTDAGSYGAPAYTSAPDGEVSKPVTVNATTYYMPFNVGGVKSNYMYTGSPITIAPTVTYSGEALTVGTDYTVSTDPATVQALGDYTLTVTGQGDTYSGTKTIQFSVVDNIPLTSDMTTLADLVYVVNEDVTISSRIQISGDVKLILGEGTTLTALKGIELSEGNSLTIEGPGALTINVNDDWKSGIGADRVGTLVINGGTINVTGGFHCAGIGGDGNNTSGGSITINGGVVNATGGGYAAGIGGGLATLGSGNRSHCGDIVINGGQVTATGMNGAAGIGPELMALTTAAR